MTDNNPPEWIVADTNESYAVGNATHLGGSVEVRVTDIITQNTDIDGGSLIATIPKKEGTDEPTDGLVLELTDEHTSITLESDGLQREWSVKMLENTPEGYAYHDGDRLAYNEDVSSEQ